MRVLFLATILAGALAGSAMAQAPDDGQWHSRLAHCGNPPARAGNDRDYYTKAMLMPEDRMIFVSLGADGAPTYRIETFDADLAMSGEFL